MGKKEGFDLELKRSDVKLERGFCCRLEKEYKI
jgi:hypothetical protein